MSMKVDRAATELARQRHADGVKRLNALFHYGRPVGRPSGWSRKRTRAARA